jgi:hypothetical protein
MLVPRLLLFNVRTGKCKNGSKRVSGKKCVSFIVSFCIKKGTQLEQELLALPEHLSLPSEVPFTDSDYLFGIFKLFFKRSKQKP